ncbi:MAG: BirA family biotin operon repressor/biotin-[acetyl-CoA-carboxylase] ligase [Flavobacteriales bacterium]|jgi:BirA family biotin operon repressor/biotin-[acetyl-CoA-carboxylase] ligase
MLCVNVFLRFKMSNNLANVIFLPPNVTSKSHLIIKAIKRMNTLFIGQNKITLQTIDSTNNYAAKLIKVSYVPDGTVIMAQNQTEGRGQRSNVWHSEPHMNLLCSFILQPKTLGTDKSFYMSAVSALAVKEAIDVVSPKADVKIKWPNDIILNDKKVGGILIENSVVKGLIKFGIIGMGVNVNQNEFSFSRATSIRNETNKVMDSDFLLKIISEKLEKWYLILLREGYNEIITAYNEALWRRDSENKIEMGGKSLIASSLSVREDGTISFSHNGSVQTACFSEAKISYE